MIYTACILLYAIFSHGQSRRYSLVLLLFIVFIALFITGYYHYLKNPLFHQNAFTLLTVIVLFKSVYAMEKTLRISHSTRHREAKEVAVKSATEAATLGEDARKEQRDKRIRGTMWQMIACGVFSVAFGFLIWNIDGLYCSTLRRWRHEAGLPWGIFLEGHGWW